MWRGGSTGNRVSPKPWQQDEDMQMQDVPDDQPNKRVVVSNSEKTRTEHVNTDKVQPEKKHKKTESNFEYQRPEKKQDPTQLNDYLERRFNSNHAWRPYMWERKRAMLMNGPVKSSKSFKYTMKNKWNSFKISWREFMYSLEVWRGSLKKIEGHQGTGVVSYFVFLRWLFFLNVFIFLLMFWVVVFFGVTFEPTLDYDSDLTGSSFTTDTTLATTCSAEYSPNVSSNALNLILDFFQGTGWMENTAMFNGYYTDKKVQLAASNYNLPLAYFLMTIIVLIISLIVMVRSTLSNFKETVLSREQSKQVNYCNTVFAGFDYSISEDQAMLLKQKSLSASIVADLEDQRRQLEINNRTSGEKCKIYTIRFFINFLIVIMLAGAGVAIYYAQDFSSEFTTDPDVENDYHSLVILVVEFLPSIVIGILNGIYPLIFDILVKFEDYRPATIIKVSLLRMVFLKLASLAMIVTSLYVQITCTDQTSCLVGQNRCPAIECWETYVGSAIYKLVISDFFIQVIITLGVELPRKIITTKCDCGIAKKVGPAIFDIPKNVLDLVYGQSLLWLGFHFAPLIPAVSVMSFFITFYLKYLSAMYNTVPPEKPYQASKSNSFFTIILMVAFFMICIPVGYTLSNMDPSPMCGPYRIYNYPADIITVQIDNSDQWFQTLWTICTSAAVISALLILLSLLVYYCSALNSAHKDLITMMKEQLVLEGKDKQYLLARISELSGNPPKKKPPPYQRSQMKTVDETAKPTKNGITMESNKLPSAASYTTPVDVADDVKGYQPPPPNPAPPPPQPRNVDVSPLPGTPQRATPEQSQQHSAMDDW